MEKGCSICVPVYVNLVLQAVKSVKLSVFLYFVFFYEEMHLIGSQIQQTESQ